jgi:hypothetical protein
MSTEGEMMQLLTLISTSILLFALGCATFKDGQSGKGHSSRDIISLSEIQMMGSNNAYQLIRTLRPHWLRSRGRKSILFDEVSYPVVYIDEYKHGSIESLAEIPVEHISEIRFLNAGDATIRFGFDHPSGAILVRI